MQTTGYEPGAGTLVNPSGKETTAYFEWGTTATDVAGCPLPVYVPMHYIDPVSILVALIVGVLIGRALSYLFPISP